MWTGSHVDSIKFSGDLIAGLSLVSKRAMILTRDVDSDINVLRDPKLLQEELVNMDLIAPEVVRIEQSVIDELPTKVAFVLPPRSLYVMQGVWRYQYGHAVSLPLLPGDVVLDSTKENAEQFEDPQHRRVSIIFRNVLSKYDSGRKY
eukprot:scaffold1636_cov165-Ochromonas_danica.AAC.8